MKLNRTTGALAGYAVIVAGFRVGVARSMIAVNLGRNLPYAFASFALLLAPLWFFAFGGDEWVRGILRWRGARILAAALLGVPYLVFAIPAGILQPHLAILMCSLPMLLGALLEFAPTPVKFAWQDAVAIGVVAALYMLHVLEGAWPYKGLGSLPKLYAADIGLYSYFIVRQPVEMGYSFVPTTSAILIGLREWALFAPFGIGLGAALKFTHFHREMPSLETAVGTIFVTFLLIAIPEEMFFRGILQNLLETRLGRVGALAVASVLFGLSHFNKGAVFNWRYVLLATIAGICYGRAWRAKRQLLASVITHTAVDVIWTLWFR
ncbi:MAG TPA: CPBP family intramembrane glutamic endopeptidase [Terriglobales bacterium]|nr:CPBP family intramembrane glutamic endopeptidase [Terriglobales bacterium]